MEIRRKELRKLIEIFEKLGRSLEISKNLYCTLKIIINKLQKTLNSYVLCNL